MATGTWDDRQGIVSLPPKLYHVGRAALGLEERDPDSPMSVVGAGRVAGEFASAHDLRPATGSSPCCCCWPGSTCSWGCSTSCRCSRSTAATSPARSTRRVAAGSRSCSGRPDPGFVDVAKLLPVAYVDGGVILVTSVVLIYADIVAPVTLT